MPITLHTYGAGDDFLCLCRSDDLSVRREPLPRHYSNLALVKLAILVELCTCKTDPDNEAFFSQLVNKYAWRHRHGPGGGAPPALALGRSHRIGSGLPAGSHKVVVCFRSLENEDDSELGNSKTHARLEFDHLHKGLLLRGVVYRDARTPGPATN